jgi:hypothetical protein
MNPERRKPNIELRFLRNSEIHYLSNQISTEVGRSTEWSRRLKRCHVEKVREDGFAMVKFNSMHKGKSDFYRGWQIDQVLQESKHIRMNV